MRNYFRFIPNLISLIRISLVIPIVLNLLSGKYIFALPGSSGGVTDAWDKIFDFVEEKLRR